MTRQEALYNFFNRFDIPAYPTTAVPENAIFPWLTYEPMTGMALDDAISITVQLWYHTESEAVPNAKVADIEAVVGLGGTVVGYDGGAIWIKRGTPWCIPTNAEGDNSVKVRQLNFELEYI